METIQKDKLVIVCESAEGPTFLWLEFLDPRDGIAFAAEVTGPSVLPIWFNITDHAPPKYKKCTESFPQRPSIPVIKRKDSEDYTGYLCQASGQTGSVMYAKRIKKDNLGINMEVFSNPKMACGKEGPNVYILSGHGAQGRVYGAGNLAGEIYLSDLEIGKNLRILVLACCNNGAFSRMTLLSRHFKNTDGSFLAILGFHGTYPGAETGQGIFRKFGRKIRSSQSIKILDAWRDAAGSTPWSAAFVRGAEEMTVLDIIDYHRIPIDRTANAIYFCSDNPVSGKDLIMPEVVGYFISNSATTTEEVLDANIAIRERLNYIEQLEAEYLNINPDKGENFLFVRKADAVESSFSKGQEYLFKFYVVRPTWDNRIDLSRVFEEAFMANTVVQPYAHCATSFPCGIGSAYMLLSVTENCASMKIKVAFRAGKLNMEDADINRKSWDASEARSQSAGDYLLEVATHAGEANPSDLVMSIIPIAGSPDKRILPNSEIFNKSNIENFPWKDHPSVMDLRAFPCRLEPSYTAQF